MEKNFNEEKIVSQDYEEFIKSGRVDEIHDMTEALFEAIEYKFGEGKLAKTIKELVVKVQIDELNKYQ